MGTGLSSIVGIVVFIVVILVLRLIGAWMLRINELIALQKETNKHLIQVVKNIQVANKRAITQEKEVQVEVKETSKPEDQAKDKEVEGMKIGQFVQFHFRRLYEEGRITNLEIHNLQDAAYCKRELNQNFTVLRTKSQGPKDEHGRNRYYTKELFCGDYLLTNDWYDRHWEPFQKWLKRVDSGRF